MTQCLAKFAKSETGATLIEYGIAMIAAIVIGGAALGGLVGQTEANFETVCNELVVSGKTADLCE
ncbi:MAG: Flp family type IVb pilin [Silicimonas sp.]|nr:Flp family type IVb pilin [Silicimonas sp.]